MAIHLTGIDNNNRAGQPAHKMRFDMTYEEMKQKVAHIESVAELQKKAVYREFVGTNAKYKIGDIVGDDSDTIRVETISYSVFHGAISIYYYGPLLTKKGEPRKDGAKRAVYESVIKQ